MQRTIYGHDAFHAPHESAPDLVQSANPVAVHDTFYLEARMSGTNPNIDTGKVFGPYLQLKDERLLASTDGTFDPNGNLNVYFPGEGNYNDNDPKVITGYWGRPIRYYRTVYKPGASRGHP